MIENKNIKIFINRVVGPVLFVWISYTIYRQISRQPNLYESVQQIKMSLFGPESWKLGMVISLMLMNWWIEARKWQVLLQPVEPISLWRSFKAVLAGLAFGFGTPNRVGEFGGRALYVSEGKRVRSVSLTIAGSISQLLITLVFGCVGLWINKDGFSGWSPGLVALAFFITLTCALAYFRLGWIVRLAGWVRLPQKWTRQLVVPDEMTVTILLRVLYLSTVRYLVFLCQYILLLDVMQVHTGWWDAFWLITVLYLILAVVPTISLLELGVRGKAGILLFQTLSTNTVGIYAASTGIWLVNLVVPAVAGGVIAIRHKIFNIKQ